MIWFETNKIWREKETIMKKVYFAGSIRGGREDIKIYEELINSLMKYFIVLTEHIADEKLANQKNKTDEYIYERDRAWIDECDFVVAEVSTPSLGVGYELGVAESLKKKVFCLYRTNSDKKLSAMIAGNKSFKIVEYNDASIINSIKNEML